MLVVTQLCRLKHLMMHTWHFNNKLRFMCASSTYVVTCLMWLASFLILNQTQAQLIWPRFDIPYISWGQG